MIPTLTPVQSSNLSAIGYDAGSSQLYVAFHSGTIYQYWGVPTIVYRGLMTASSHGTYFNVFVRGGYPCTRVV